MHILIIGQGISGTMLSWYLHQANIPFTVIDNAINNSASKVAAGLINPVTGRRIVTTWMIDEIMPFAVTAYKSFSKQFNQAFIHQKPIIDFFPTLQMREAFYDRVSEGAPYLSLPEETNFSVINHHLGYGSIAPAYVVQLAKLVAVWRTFLQEKNNLIEALFDENLLDINEKQVNYKDNTATHIIYANGYQTEQSKFWNRLPFAPNKGEALLIRCAALAEDVVYKKGISIIPQGNQLFWVGANYIWKYDDDAPTGSFLEQTTSQLKEILNLPFEVLAHRAGIRPANIERRPFVGFHPVHTNIGIFSGMGAKGSSLAPFFANELVNHLTAKTKLTESADVQRFKKILSM